MIGSNFINDETSIDNYGGSIVISKSTFKNSQVTSIRNSKTMKISDSTFTKCVGAEGVMENFGSVNISSSTFKNNKGTLAGAITNMGTMSIRSSKFTSNTAKKYAGA